MIDDAKTRAVEQRSRRQFVAHMLGAVAAAAFPMAGRPAAGAPQQQSARDAWQASIEAGWRAVEADQYQAALQAFARARTLGGLRAWEYHASVRCFAALDRDSDALVVASECAKLHPGPDSSAVLALANHLTGNHDLAMDCLRSASKLRGADPRQGVYGDVYGRLAGREMVITHWVSQADMVDDGRRVFQELGHYVSCEPRSEPWQVVEVLNIEGADRYERVTDQFGNHLIKLWPRGGEPVEVAFKVTRSACLKRPVPTTEPYVVPDEYARYLSRTTRCDPDTALVARYSEPLRQATRWETVRAVHDWWWVRNRGLSPDYVRRDEPGLPASELLLRQLVRDGEMHGVCGEEAAVACALLRRLGIAATQVFAFFFKDEPFSVTHGHEWPVYYEPMLGWVSLINGKTPVGEFPGDGVAWYQGETVPGEKVLGSHVTDLGWFWYACCNGPKGDAFHFRAQSERRTLDL